MKIPGLTFSWKRALGITQAKQQISRKTGIPMSKQGIERKIGKMVINTILGKNNFHTLSLHSLSEPFGSERL